MRPILLALLLCALSSAWGIGTLLGRDKLASRPGCAEVTRNMTWAAIDCADVACLTGGGGYECETVCLRSANTYTWTPTVCRSPAGVVTNNATTSTTTTTTSSTTTTT